MLNIYHPQAKVIIFVGNFGSGKTEIAINYALKLAAHQKEVTIIDLDVIKPYFRCRAATELMRLHGIRVVIPSGEHRYADLPIIVPEIKGLIASNPGITILDVGGEDVGAKVLSYLGEAFTQLCSEIQYPEKNNLPYQLLLVINKNRPFTSDWNSVHKIFAGIEKSSGLKMTGLISNNHLMEDTSLEMVSEGYELVQEVSKNTGLPIYFIAISEFLEKAAREKISVPILPISRHLLPPHLSKGKWSGI